MTEADFRILLVVCYKALNTEAQRFQLKEFLNNHKDSLLKLDVPNKTIMVLHFISGMLNIQV